MPISSALGSSALLPSGLGFRNAIINGGFDIWQRGTSFTNAATGSYTTDRWLHVYDGSGATRIISRGQFQPALSGATITASLPSDISLTNFLRFDQTVAGTGATANLFQQLIENVRLLAGKTVTLSFYAKASASLTIPRIDCLQNFGQGGGSSSVVTIIKTNESVTTSWQKFSYTFLLPSASGKTIGSVNDSHTGLRFFLPINTVFTFDITGVQLEANVQPTPFEQRPIGTELSLCQRYYWRTGQTAFMPAWLGAAINTTQLVGSISFPVSMRTSPVLATGGSAMTYTILPDRYSTDQAMFYVSSSGFTSGYAYRIYGDANGTSFVEFRAEL